MTAQQKTVEQAKANVIQLAYLPQRPTKAMVDRAMDTFFAALDAAHQPRKQFTPPRKETKVNNNDAIRTANAMAMLMADVAGSKRQDDQFPRASDNDGAVVAILKALENPVDQWGTPIEPGHEDYRAPLTYGDDAAGPSSPVLDLSIQHPMKGWNTMDACLYRKQIAAQAEQDRWAERARIRASVGCRD